MTAADTSSWRPRSRALRAYIGRPFMAVNEALWPLMPARLHRFGPVLRYGQWLHRLVLLRHGGVRWQNPGTYFMRNRAELAFAGRLVSALPQNAPFSVAILGCSIGAEATSMAWAMALARPDVTLDIHASDIDPVVIETARGASYKASGREFMLISDTEKQLLFEPLTDGAYRVREAWRRLLHWSLFDATRSDIVDVIGERDLVVANRFLCHMQPEAARSTLRNIIRLVKPGGVLLVSGIDLDVRGEITREAGLVPIEDRLDELYDGDPTLRDGWPFNYWGLEPLDRSPPDWRHRCAIAFRKPV